MTRPPVVAVLDRMLSAERAAELLPGARIVADLAEPEAVTAVIAGPATRLTGGLIESMTGLRVVASTSAGYDHLPVDELARHGAWVTSVPDYCVEEVADHALTLILDLLRQVSLHDRALHAGGWRLPPGPAGPPRRIAGTTLGVVGLGRTGRGLAARAAALGMRVLGWAPRVRPDRQAAGVELVTDLDRLLAAADVVSVHLALNEQTRGLLDKERLAHLRPGAMLVNVARGPIVDAGALAEALASGRLAGLALDVYDDEPLPADHPLRASHAVLTPHIAWWSNDSVRAGGERAAAAVAAVLDGAIPAGVVARPATNAREGSA
ncbi:NAD(P)-dependent oxidoreductase [Dactylosporangium sp. NPDC005572]|uniref:2-hydroxyacid dehydrogenase n=1 Tax=Dactylosporangium sp. NPDC005572 TaxID=3156889 RepID=UPI0033B879A4